MVALIAAIILFPLALCSSGLTVLTPSENNKRMEKCGKSRNQSDYVMNLNNNVKLLFISPIHFIADVSLIKVNYSESKCKSDDNFVFRLATMNISAKLIGPCGVVPVGFVLGEFHQESNISRTDYLCIKDEEVPVGLDILVAMADGRFQKGNVVKCNNPKPSIFCVSTEPKALGAILFENALVGEAKEKNDSGSIVVEYLHNHNDAIRKSAGIYNERAKTPQPGAETTAKPKDSGITSKPNEPEVTLPVDYDCEDYSCFNDDVFVSTCGAVSIFISFFLVFLMVN